MPVLSTNQHGEETQLSSIKGDAGRGLSSEVQSTATKAVELAKGVLQTGFVSTQAC